MHLSAVQFILFYFILFYFILFYFILFYFILFYFILFYRKLSLSTNCIEKIANLNGLSMYKMYLKNA